MTQADLSGQAADNPESPFADDDRAPESEDPDHGQTSLRGWDESQATIDSYGGE